MEKSLILITILLGGLSWLFAGLLPAIASLSLGFAGTFLYWQGRERIIENAVLELRGEPIPGTDFKILAAAWGCFTFSLAICVAAFFK